MTITTESTGAKMGRSMKKSEIIGVPSPDQLPRRDRCAGHFRLDRVIQPCPLQIVHDNFPLVRALVRGQLVGRRGGRRPLRAGWGPRPHSAGGGGLWAVG